VTAGALLGAFLVGGSLVVVLIVFVDGRDFGDADIDCSDFRFDSRAWIDDADGGAWVEANKREEPSVRQRLADGLIECDTLVGKRRAEVMRMLGEPAVAHVDGEEAASWVTGVERGYINIDNEHLIVRFHPDGRAASAELVTD
jgi:hypothetical protein